MTAVPKIQPVRVAIYTRKSVTEGLDQEFNSLDAQRASIEAYVLSQAGLGWRAIGKRYDDGGFTGANTDRPAFQALLADVRAGLVDVVAVYKIDRLSRSLLDFAHLIDLFEKQGVTFVSVTQQFSTANSIGKLTLNILMSFAEFEREVISERITDKMQATRRRGMWTGGRPVLGYDVVDKKLVVNQDEATQVREIFGLYLELGTLRKVVAELKRRGWTNKTFVGKRGQAVTGVAFSKNTLQSLLTNDLYRGQIRCKDGLVQGAHAAIVDEAVWTAVQAKLQGNRAGNGVQARNKAGAILRGLVQCGRCGSAMTHTFTTRGKRRHRYYVCQRAHDEGATACPNTRVPAGPFEAFVAEQIRAIGADDAVVAHVTAAVTRRAAERREQITAELRRLDAQARRQGDADTANRQEELRVERDALDEGIDAARVRAALQNFQPVWSQLFPIEQERILRLLIDHVRYDPDTQDVEVALRDTGIGALAAEAT